MTAAIHHTPGARATGVGGATAALDSDLVTVQARRAGIVTRLAANTVDTLVVVVVIVAGYATLSALLFLWSPSTFHFPTSSEGVLLITAGSVLFCYLTLAWRMTGRTYGDHLLGLRVVNYRGEGLRLAGAALRAAICVCFPIGILYVLVSPANRAVHDVIVRTSVVYDWEGQTELPRRD